MVQGKKRLGAGCLELAAFSAWRKEDDRDHEAAAFSSSVHQGKEEKGVWTQPCSGQNLFGYNVPFILSQKLSLTIAAKRKKLGHSIEEKRNARP